MANNDFHLTGEFPLGRGFANEDGSFQVWEAYEGTGHQLRYPGDPQRFVVSKVVDHDPEEGDIIHFGFGRFETFAQAREFVAAQ